MAGDVPFEAALGFAGGFSLADTFGYVGAGFGTVSGALSGGRFEGRYAGEASERGFVAEAAWMRPGDILEFPRFGGHVFCDRVRGSVGSLWKEVFECLLLIRRSSAEEPWIWFEQATSRCLLLLAGWGFRFFGLRRWVSQAEIDEGRAPGMSTEERQELTKLRRENRVLRMERDLLSRAAAFFAQENVLPK